MALEEIYREEPRSGERIQDYSVVGWIGPDAETDPLHGGAAELPDDVDRRLENMGGGAHSRPTNAGRFRHSRLPATAIASFSDSADTTAAKSAAVPPFQPAVDPRLFNFRRI